MSFDKREYFLEIETNADKDDVQLKGGTITVNLRGNPPDLRHEIESAVELVESRSGLKVKWVSSENARVKRIRLIEIEKVEPDEDKED